MKYLVASSLSTDVSITPGQPHNILPPMYSPQLPPQQHVIPRQLSSSLSTGWAPLKPYLVSSSMCGNASVNSSVEKSVRSAATHGRGTGVCQTWCIAEKSWGETTVVVGYYKIWTSDTGFYHGLGELSSYKWITKPVRAVTFIMWLIFRWQRVGRMPFPCPIRVPILALTIAKCMLEEMWASLGLCWVLESYICSLEEAANFQ